MARQIFTSSGTFTPPEGVTSVSVLIVGGGGGGGRAGSGGAGGSAGQVRWVSSSSVSGPVSVTIGAGGAGRSVSSGTGATGSSSFFGSLEAIGGGGGAAGSASTPGQGAHGGGGHSSSSGNRAGATGLIGFKGGDGVNNAGTFTTAGAGGGGGAGGNGYDGSYLADISVDGGSGGPGIEAGTFHEELDDLGWIGGGGGGGTQNNASIHATAGAGGLGGGGGGGTDANLLPGVDGQANTGGGGGGGGGSIQDDTTDGGSGGSGIVVVIYSDTSSIATSTANLTNPENRWVKPALRVSWFDGTNWGAILPTLTGHALIPNINAPIDGTIIDTRQSSRPTTAYHDGWLGVLRGHPTQTLFSSFNASNEYAVLVADAVIPLTTEDNDASPISLLRSSNGYLWAAVAESNAVKVSRSTNNGASWGAAQTLITMNSSSGIAVLAQSGSTVVLYATEDDATDDDRYVRVINEASGSYAAGSWDSEVLPSLPLGTTADDHASIDTAPDGRIFVASKTTVSTEQQLIYVLQRSTSGTWTQVAVLESGPDTDGFTRPSISITDEQLYVFYGSFEAPTNLYRRTAYLGNPSVWSSRTAIKTGANWSDSSISPTSSNIISSNSGQFPILVHNVTSGSVITEWQSYPYSDPVSFVDAGVVEYSLEAMSTTFTLPLSANILPGDLIVCSPTTATTNETILTPPAGAQTLLAMQGDGDSSISTGIYAWEVPTVKPVDITFTWSANRRGSLSWIAFRKNITGEYSLIFSASEWIESLENIKAPPQIETTKPNAYILGGVAQNSGSQLITPPDGWTSRVNASERDGFIATKGIQPIAGASDDALFAVVNAQVHLLWQLAIEIDTAATAPSFVQATLATEIFPGFTGDIADGAAIIPDSSNPAESVVLLTNKAEGGGIYVVGLDGHIKSSLLPGAANSVDWRDLNGNASWGNRILILTTDREAELLRYMWLDRTTKTLSLAGSTTLGWEPYGSCLYMHSDGKIYAFVTQRGPDDTSPRSMYQYELSITGATVSSGAPVRTIALNSVVEGLAADDKTGYLFASEENIGLYRYSAAPDGGSTRTAIDTVGAGNLVDDIEDIAIARHKDGDKLLVSSQGDSTYHVYDIQTLAHEKTFAVYRPDGTTRVVDTDGLDVYLGYLGPTFPNGLIAIHDAEKTPTSNVVFVDALSVFGHSKPFVIKARQNGTTVSLPGFTLKGMPQIARGAVRINGETIPFI